MLSLKIEKIISFIILISNISFSQSLYIRVGGGYGLSIGTASIGEKLVYNQDSTTVICDTYSAKNIKAAFSISADPNYSTY